MDSGVGRCWGCEGEGRLWCSQCRLALYCSNTCQKKDAARHLDECAASSRRRVTCSYCGREETLGGVPCPGCLVVAYCSDPCRKMDTKAHRSVCLQAKTKVVEAAKKMSGWSRRAKGIPQYIGRVIHAVDYIRWSENEGSRIQASQQEHLMTSKPPHSNGTEPGQTQNKEAPDDVEKKEDEDEGGGEDGDNENEGERKDERGEEEETLRLLLLGADLKHVLCSLHNTPDHCTQELELTLVDSSPHILARDLLLLFLLLLPLEDHVPRADHAHAQKVVMVFYSVCLDMETHTLLYDTLHNLLNLSHETFLQETRRQISVDEVTYRLAQAVWSGWMNFANDPEALQKLEKIRTLKQSGRAVREVLGRYIKSCPRQHQRAVSDWVKRGSLNRTHNGNFPNVTLACFSPLKSEHLDKFEDVVLKWSEETEWLQGVGMEDDMVYAPHGMDIIFQDWDYHTVVRSVKQDVNLLDMYQLYLTQVFVQTRHQLLHSSRVSLNFVRAHVRDLAIHPKILKGKFDRIATGIQADLLGTPYVLQHLGKRLREDNIFARLVTHHRVWSVCLEWRGDQQAREACYKSRKIKRAPDPLLLLTGRWATFRHFLQAELLYHLHQQDARPLHPDNAPVFHNVRHAYHMLLSDYTRHLNNIVPFRFQEGKRTASMVDSRLYTLEWRRLTKSRLASTPVPTYTLPSSTSHNIYPAVHSDDNLISLSQQSPQSPCISVSEPAPAKSNQEALFLMVQQESNNDSHFTNSSNQPVQQQSNDGNHSTKQPAQHNSNKDNIFTNSNSQTVKHQPNNNSHSTNSSNQPVKHQSNSEGQYSPSTNQPRPRSLYLPSHSKSPLLSPEFEYLERQDLLKEIKKPSIRTYAEIPVGISHRIQQVFQSESKRERMAAKSALVSPELARKTKAVKEKASVFERGTAECSTFPETRKNLDMIPTRPVRKLISMFSRAFASRDKEKVMEFRGRYRRSISLHESCFPSLEMHDDEIDQAKNLTTSLRISRSKNKIHKYGEIDESGLCTFSRRARPHSVAASKFYVDDSDDEDKKGIMVKQDELRLVNLTPGSPRLPGPVSPTLVIENFPTMDWPDPLPIPCTRSRSDMSENQPTLPKAGRPDSPRFHLRLDSPRSFSKPHSSNSPQLHLKVDLLGSPDVSHKSYPSDIPLHQQNPIDISQSTESPLASPKRLMKVIPSELQHEPPPIAKSATVALQAATPDKTHAPQHTQLDTLSPEIYTPESDTSNPVTQGKEEVLHCSFSPRSSPEFSQRKLSPHDNGHNGASKKSNTHSEYSSRIQSTNNKTIIVLEGKLSPQMSSVQIHRSMDEVEDKETANVMKETVTQEDSCVNVPIAVAHTSTISALLPDSPPLPVATIITTSTMSTVIDVPAVTSTSSVNTFAGISASTTIAAPDTPHTKSDTAITAAEISSTSVPDSSPASTLSFVTLPATPSTTILSTSITRPKYLTSTTSSESPPKYASLTSNASEGITISTAPVSLPTSATSTSAVSQVAPASIPTPYSPVCLTSPSTPASPSKPVSSVSPTTPVSLTSSTPVSFTFSSTPVSPISPSTPASLISPCTPASLIFPNTPPSLIFPITIAPLTMPTGPTPTTSGSPSLPCSTSTTEYFPSSSMSSSLTAADMEVSDLLAHEEKFCPIQDFNKGREESRPGSRDAVGLQHSPKVTDTNSGASIEIQEEKQIKAKETATEFLKPLEDIKTLVPNTPTFSDLLSTIEISDERSICESPSSQGSESKSESMCKTVEQFAQRIQEQKESLQSPVTAREDTKYRRASWDHEDTQTVYQQEPSKTSKSSLPSTSDRPQVTERNTEEKDQFSHQNAENYENQKCKYEVENDEGGSASPARGGLDQPITPPCYSPTPLNKMVEQFSMRIKAQYLPTSPRSSRPNSIGTLIQQDFMRLYSGSPTQDSSGLSSSRVSEDDCQEPNFHLSDDEEEKSKTVKYDIPSTVISPLEREDSVVKEAGRQGDRGRNKSKERAGVSVSGEKAARIKDNGKNIKSEEIKHEDNIDKVVREERETDEYRSQEGARMSKTDAEKVWQTKKAEGIIKDKGKPVKTEKGETEMKETDKSMKVGEMDKITNQGLRQQFLQMVKGMSKASATLEGNKEKDESTYSGHTSGRRSNTEQQTPVTSEQLEKKVDDINENEDELKGTDDYGLLQYTVQVDTLGEGDRAFSLLAAKEGEEKHKDSQEFCLTRYTPASQNTGLMPPQVSARESRGSSPRQMGQSNTIPRLRSSRTGGIDEISFRKLVKEEEGQEEEQDQKRVIEYTSRFEVSTDNLQDNSDSIEEAVEAFSFLENDMPSYRSSEDSDEDTRKRTKLEEQLETSIGHSRLKSMQNVHNIQQESENKTVPQVISSVAINEPPGVFSRLAEHVSKLRLSDHTIPSPTPSPPVVPVLNRRLHCNSLTRKHKHTQPSLNLQVPSQDSQTSPNTTIETICEKSRNEDSDAVGEAEDTARQEGDAPVATVVSVVPKIRDATQAMLSPPQYRPVPKKRSSPSLSHNSASDNLSQSLIKLIGSGQGSSPREKLPTPPFSRIQSDVMKMEQAGSTLSLTAVTSQGEAGGTSSMQEEEVFMDAGDSPRAGSGEVRLRAGVLKNTRDTSRESRRSLRVSWGDLHDCQESSSSSPSQSPTSVEDKTYHVTQL